MRRCIQSLLLQGTIECYYVFDKTSYRTGLNAIKNTAPYTGISLNFCALQLDDGPVKTSTICFDNSGLDPNHPYVIARVRMPPASGYQGCKTLLCKGCTEERGDRKCMPASSMPLGTSTASEVPQGSMGRVGLLSSSSICLHTEE